MVGYAMGGHGMLWYSTASPHGRAREVGGAAVPRGAELGMLRLGMLRF